MFGFLKKKPDFPRRWKPSIRGWIPSRFTIAGRNIEMMKRLFQGVDIMRYAPAKDQRGRSYAVVFSRRHGQLPSSSMKTYQAADGVLRAGADLIKQMTLEVIHVNESELVGEFAKIITSVTYGDTVRARGRARRRSSTPKHFALRSIEEPDSEILVGPREGFNESLMQNLSMLRRRARTNDFKIRQMTLAARRPRRPYATLTASSTAACSMSFSGGSNRPT